MPKGFRIKASGSLSPPDPEALFRNLRRSTKVPYLWSHQSDLLRSYEREHRATPDVALELPTGSGKTLVGLLVGEWRRQTFEERVLYLAPTRQLCYQVSELASNYGIRAHVLVGAQDEYPADEYGDFATARSIAITTYSGIFNFKPRLRDAQVLILDDAHAAENYVSALWTVSIRRSDVPDLFESTLDLLAPEIPAHILAMARGTAYEPGLISAVPFPSIWKVAQSVRDLLNARMEAKALPEGIRFPWLMIREHLDACQMYYSWNEISVRPVLPPTWIHEPFSNAQQRIYMSATLGEGGDLERIFGVQRIERLPVPKGWEKQGSGRRLILFPDRSLPDGETEQLLIESIKRHGRALVICTSRTAADSLSVFFEDTLPQHQVFKAPDIEKSLEPFVTEDKAILLLAGRYDGLDLPDDTCRLVVIHGLPAGVNLQERFLYERIGAAPVLRDRVRTRLTQAMGRCTRNSTDYATVLLAGDRLFDFCSKSETRRGLHPEIQAEMTLGLDNSEDQESAKDFLELIELFLARGKEWEVAESEIARLRDLLQKKASPSTEVLAAVVASEIEYVKGLWSGKYEHALEAARRVADGVSGTELTSYRAWWYYLAGIPAYLLVKEKGRSEQDATVRDLWHRARSASLQPWFRELDAHLSIEPEKLAGEATKVSTVALEAASANLIQLGLVGTKFDKVTGEIEIQLAQKDSTQFELGLQGLGRLLGWDASRPDEMGAPDGVWLLADEIVLLFEAKTDEDPAGRISKATLTQARGHHDWSKAKLTMKATSLIAVVVVSPRRHLDPVAVPHAGNTYLVEPGEVRSLAAKAISELRSVRGRSTEDEQLAIQWAIYETFRKEALLPEDIHRWMTTRKITSLPVK